MRRILLICTFALMTISSWAVKANSEPVDIKQADGTTITVILCGDEDFHYYKTLDGALLVRESHGFFIAEVNTEGELTSTGILAHNALQRNAQEKAAVRTQNRNLFYKTATSTALKVKARKEPVATNSTLFPHTGTPKVLVVLAQFTDTVFTLNNVKEAFNQYLNGEGPMINYGNRDTKNYGSVRQYFSDMSFGQFKPTFDIVGPITLNHELKYYGAGKDNMSLFIPDVCKAADDAGVDFSQYDENKDGYLDLIYVIYAGYSQSFSGNPAECIWPKSGTINGGTYDGIKVLRYGVNNELNGVSGQQIGWMNGIGLFLHEFSHCMGMPDLYATTAASEECQKANNQMPDRWSIMDSGCYLNNGYTPSAYTAWEREAFGWMQIDTLKEAGMVELKTIDNGGKAYRIMNDNDLTGNEYFIVENIQKEGWNSKALGNGMLVFHVDYDKTAFSLNSNSVNNVLGHPRFSVLPADSVVLSAYNAKTQAEWNYSFAGDPFPGVGNVYNLTDTSRVKPVLYKGESLNKPIYDIEENTETGVVTFAFLQKKETLGITVPVATSRDSDKRIYSIDGRYLGTDTGILPKGIYIMNRKKFVVK